MSEKFGSKAETLEFLASVLNKSKIEDLIYFSVEEWENKPQEILNSIQDRFGNKIVVVRSSGILEDTENFSNAGKFSSYLDIDPTDQTKLVQSIESVISSYKKENYTSGKSQILIQEQLQNSKCSGVVFTVNPKSCAPYYLICYDDESSKTDKVTSGRGGKTLFIYKYSDKDIDETWEKLISSISEIEAIYDSTPLDIEFAIDCYENIHILQVRKLICQNNSSIPANKFKELFDEEITKLPIHAALSNMAFWNPAEIIGSNPNPLALSLYNWLVLDRSWNQGISLMGYTETQERLYEVVFGRSYIKVETAIFSLIPQVTSPAIKKDLERACVSKLRMHPELHDKIEFDVIPNCYTFATNRILQLSEFDLISSEDKEQFINDLKSLTNNILRNWKATMLLAEKEVTEEWNRYSERADSQNLDSNLQIAIEALNGVRNIGVIHFASVARLAFIGKSILMSLLSEGIITESEYQLIMSNIKTVATEFVNSDLSSSEYGHLRSGTYDIRALPLSKLNLKREIQIHGDNISHEVKIGETVFPKISKALKDNRFDISGKELIDFILEAQSQREKIKFIFTKQLSYALELIAEYGEMKGLSRDYLSYLKIDDLFDFGKAFPKEIIQKKIELNRNMQGFYNMVEVPDYIFTKQNLLNVYISSAKPNFVTSKCIEGEICIINQSELSASNASQIEDKIVLIENADPGYDWIFSYNIKGLITKYGGAASHMSIRCNEFQIPAALGCGADLYLKLLNARKIELDCRAQHIKAMDLL